MAQTLQSPQRYRGFVLTAAGLQKLQARIKQVETQTRLRQSARTIAERVQLNDPNGIHPITVRKILSGQNGVDKRSIQLVFQVLQLQFEIEDCAHAGLCQSAIEPLPAESRLSSKPQDWSSAVDEITLYGRDQELAQLNQAVTERCRLVQILGVAGIGKTALATGLVSLVQPEFDIVIWKSLHHAPCLSTILTSLLQAMQPTGEPIELPTSVEALMRLLIEQFQQRRCLVVLDHFNSVLGGQQYAGYCRPGYEAYGELLQLIAEVRHQSCLVITSREQPRAIRIEQERCQSLQLFGLLPTEQQQISNCYHQLIGSVEEWQALIQQYQGNPLALKIAAVYIQNYFNSQISEYLSYLKKDHLILSDLRNLLDQQFANLTSVEQQLAYRLAQYRVPISASQFRQDVKPFMQQQHWLEGLDSLSRRSLLCRQGMKLNLEPMLKAYINGYLIYHQDKPSSKPNLKAV